MKITLLGEDTVRYEMVPGGLTIESESPDQQYSPFHMLGSSLAVCTFSVLASWASHADIASDDLSTEVAWTFAEQPHRIGEIRLTIIWPSLPDSRREAAKRAATLCPVHATLQHSPTIIIEDRR